MPNNKRPKTDNSLLWKYAGMVMQFFVSIGIAVYLGLKIDEWVGASIPLGSWLLPLLVIGAIIIKVFRDTGPKKN